MDTLYVAVGDGGLIKVGRTTNLKSRMAGLKKQFRLRGESLVQMRAVQEFKHSAYGAENMTIRALEDFSFCEFGREWFRGVSFELAIELAAACGQEAIGYDRPHVKWTAAMVAEADRVRKARVAAERERRAAWKLQNEARLRPIRLFRARAERAFDAITATLVV